LLIGSFFILSNSGCDKNDVDYIASTNYYYVNETQYQIELEVFNSSKELIKNYLIQPIDTLSFSIKTEGGAGPFQFTDTKGFGDSIYLTFSDLRYLSLRKDYDSIFFEKSYIKTKISDKEYDLYYFFTDETFNNALELKQIIR
jgi:hypothetical protein